MKKVLLVAAIVVMASGVLVGNSYADMQENVGCGLGTMLLEDTRDSLLFELFALTTNGSSGNQTFGITSGTLGCERPDSIVSNELLKFAADNMDNLAKDIAMGQGESLDTLAELMEVQAAKKAEFYATLQANFSGIFTSEKVQVADVIDNIVRVSSES